MVDHFAVLNEPRRPWLDAAALKEKFLTLSAAVHPDRVHQAPETERRAANELYTALNAAYTCLREPKDRLAHLLELIRGVRPAVIQNIPPDLMEMFFDVGRNLKEADAFLAEKAGVKSPLLKAQLFNRGQALSERLATAREQLATRTESLAEELRRLDAEWVTGHEQGKTAPLLDRLEEIYRLLSYFSRWSGQLQERIFQLTL